MAVNFSDIIKAYCEDNGIFIPSGFYRLCASHLVVIRLNEDTPKLVAKTFFKRVDLIYYLISNLKSLELNSDGYLPAKVIDFKADKEFNVNSDCRLVEL